MKHFYPSVPLAWARLVVSLKPRDIAYGISQGFLAASPTDEKLTQTEQLAGVAKDVDKLVDVRDALFRLLLIHLYKHFFLIDCPLRALEFLVTDFEDCPTAAIGGGRLLSGVAGIAEGPEEFELDPEYFARKVRAFHFLTEFVTEIVREMPRSN